MGGDDSMSIVLPERKIGKYAVRGLVLANTTQIFPEDRGTNYAVRLGDDAARALLDWLPAKS